MSPRERAVAALELREPDFVPTFELEFQLSKELLGCDFVSTDGLMENDLDQALAHNAELHVRIAERLDYSIVRSHDPRVIARLAEMGAGTTYLLCGEADGTMPIPDGTTMEDLALALVESPLEVHEQLRASAEAAIHLGRTFIDSGAEMLTMCADYCFNTGPFLSPAMFAEFVTPYLQQVVASHRQNGAYVVKHTDGNIMPILDQLMSAQPHGLHSLDPQGGVDIAEVKRLVGGRVCLCGNVNCALMQTGTLDQIRESAEYALRHGMPGGGYIYCTSNVAFKGMELDRYLLMLEIRREQGAYPAAPSVGILNENLGM